MANTNLFTFNPFTGLTAGVALTMNAIGSRGQSLPPHVMCSGNFLAVEKGWQHPPLDRTGHLQAASVYLIEPQHGGKPFSVLVPKNVHSDALYVHVVNNKPEHVKLLHRPDDVCAWSMITVQGDIDLILQSKQSMEYFIGFHSEGDEVSLWYPTGHIARLVRRGDEVVSVPLTAREIAEERVYQLQSQLEEVLEEDAVSTKRRHGILWGGLRVLRTVSDRKAQDVWVDFFTDQLQYMNDHLREAIRAELLKKAHPFAGNFLPGWSENVVSLHSAKPSAGKAAALAKKRDRADKDRDLRAAMRGGQGGGGNQQKKK